MAENRKIFGIGFDEMCEADELFEEFVESFELDRRSVTVTVEPCGPIVTFLKFEHGDRLKKFWRVSGGWHDLDIECDDEIRAEAKHRGTTALAVVRERALKQFPEVSR